MKRSIRFLGGAGTVTGSKFLLTLDETRVLVDCGLFQGLKELRLQNWSPFPVDVRGIDAVILTHAHLDHTGYLPVLVRQGFTGKIYATAPTRDLTRVILMDSANLLEEDAVTANSGGYSKHHPAKPLYTSDDAAKALRQITAVQPEEWMTLTPEIRFRFRPNGHILGSCFVEIEAGGRRIAFSGDLGRSDPLVLPPSAKIEQADYVIVESTYGDRLHSPLSPLRELAKVVNETLERKGQLLIPSFAVGRTQDVLFLLSKLKGQCQIPDIPIFLDSPMATAATEIFSDYPEWHRLTQDEVRDLSKGLTIVRSQQQSEELRRSRESAVVIAGSGMLSGGRILSHLIRRLPDERNTVLLVGFQAAGTRGSLLRGGINELKMYGEYVTVRARVEEISSLSAHADQREILEWLGTITAPPKRTFIVHGEPQAADALRVRIHDRLGWSCTIPKADEEFPLD